MLNFCVRVTPYARVQDQILTSSDLSVRVFVHPRVGKHDWAIDYKIIGLLLMLMK